METLALLTAPTLLTAEKLYARLALFGFRHSDAYDWTNHAKTPVPLPYVEKEGERLFPLEKFVSRMLTLYGDKELTVSEVAALCGHSDSWVLDEARTYDFDVLGSKNGLKATTPSAQGHQRKFLFKDIAHRLWDGYVERRGSEFTTIQPSPTRYLAIRDVCELFGVEYNVVHGLGNNAAYKFYKGRRYYDLIDMYDRLVSRRHDPKQVGFYLSRAELTVYLGKHGLTRYDLHNWCALASPRRITMIERDGVPLFSYLETRERVLAKKPKGTQFKAKDGQLKPFDVEEMVMNTRTMDTETVHTEGENTMSKEDNNQITQESALITLANLLKESRAEVAQLKEQLRKEVQNSTELRSQVQQLMTDLDAATAPVASRVLSEAERQALSEFPEFAGV